MVRQIGAGRGVALSDDEVEFILWERTAFPLAVHWQVEEQVREYLDVVVDRFGRRCPEEQDRCSARMRTA